MLKNSHGSTAVIQRSYQTAAIAQSTQVMSLTMRSQLQTCLTGLMQGTWPVYVPESPMQWASDEKGHFHLFPQLFLQLSGWTRFRFPEAAYVLRAGEVLLVPARLLHFETAGSEASGDPFRTLVISSENGSMSCHVGYEAGAGVPDMLYLEGLQHPQALRVQALLSDVPACSSAGAWSKDAEARVLHARALLAAAVSSVLRTLDDVQEGVTEPPVVTKVRALVQHHLGDQQLSVRVLAAQSGCSAHYLSTLFHQVTGEHLVAYINRLRVARAVTLLKESQLTGKEVAWACGFTTHSYFIRVFREHFKMSPQAWRADQ